MRVKSKLLREYREIDVICVIASKFLGLTELKAMPYLTSGFQALREVVSPDAFIAIRNARLMNLKTNSIAQLKAAVDAEIPRVGILFNVNKDDLTFTVAAGAETEIEAVAAELLGVPSRAVNTVNFVDPAKKFVFPLINGNSVHIELPATLQRPILPPIKHPVKPKSAPRGFDVGMNEILAAAREMDEIDHQRGYVPGNWCERFLSGLNDELVVGLKERSFDGRLVQADGISVAGLCNILGLPGTGKTTLIVILNYIAAKRGLRCATFTTSVAVADELRETLCRYGVKGELLYGSSPASKASHARKYGDLLAAQAGSSGFGFKTDSAIRFATGCMLEALVPEDRAELIPSGTTPCHSLSQARNGKNVERLTCPLISSCGRHFSSRNLVSADAWFGHIAVLETSVPKFLSEEKLTYAELIAQQVDIVFFDEADAIQKSLDASGVQQQSLYGRPAKDFAEFISRVSQLNMSGDTDWSSKSETNVVRAAIHIGRHLAALHQHVIKLDRDVSRRPLLEKLSDKILNVAALMGSLKAIVGSKSRLSDDAFYEIGSDLERALRTVFFYDARRGDLHTENPFHEASERYNGTVTSGLEDASISDIAAKFTELLQLQDMRPEDSVAVMEYVQILCNVIACVVHIETINRTLPHAPRIAAIAPSSMTGGVKAALLPIMAESVVGHFSGLLLRLDRHETNGTLKAVRLDYETRRGTARLLPARLCEMPGEDRGPHVISLSATSFMPKSKTYHLSREPDYILARLDKKVSSQYEFVFAPVVDRDRRVPVAVSGTGENRIANLQAVIREAFNPSDAMYDSHRSSLHEDRRMAIIVNSYDQVDVVLNELERCNPSLRARTIGIAREYDGMHLAARGYRTAQEATLLGKVWKEWDCLVFPQGAFGRGVNLVFPSGHELVNRAIIGTMFCPIRPHPAQDDATFIQGKIAKMSEELDLYGKSTKPCSVQEYVEFANRLKWKALGEIRDYQEMAASPLKTAKEDDADSFAANIIVELGQVFGRAIRGGLSAKIVFLDAAWAPQTAKGAFDSPRTSILLRAAKIIRGIVAGDDPVQRELMTALYGNILEAIDACSTIHTGPDESEDYYD